jgi:carboxyl-terminal processing protease
MRGPGLLAAWIVGAAAWAGGGGAARADNMSASSLPPQRFADAERAFREARAILLREHLDDKLAEEDTLRAATAGMVSGAGARKWDALLSPAELAEMRADLSGEVVGVGVEIKHDEDGGTLLVMGVIPSTPAARGGVQAGDRVLKIDGTAVKGRAFRDVVYAIRGKPGTRVTLTILRDDQVLQKTLTRESMQWSPVESAMLPNGVGLVTVRAFTDKTPPMLRAALDKLLAAKPRALVIDLRGNEGGLFERVIDCAALFVPRGATVVTKVGRGGREEAYRTQADPLARLPIGVLVNGHTASSAELLAGALKEDVGARVVGMRTMGKWNVQKIEELPNGWAIKFTVGVFRSPRGELLDGKGLDPDVEVAMDDNAVEKAQRIADGNARVAADSQLRAVLALLK